MEIEPIDRVIEELNAHLEQQHQEIEIPRTSGRNYIQKYIDQLPRPSISSTHSEDHMCLMCRIEYETDAEKGEDKDIAVQLPCGHILGSSCIAMWASSKLSVTCPLCTKPFLPDGLFGRTNDVRRYLFWMLRNYNYPVARCLLEDMDSYNGENAGTKFLQDFVARAIRRNHGIIEDLIASLIQYLQSDKKRKRILNYQATPENEKMFKLTIARRAERDGMNVEAYLHASVMRVAAGYIMHGLPEDRLESLLAGFVCPKFLDTYSKDTEYGPDGTCVEYWLLPGVKLEHVGSIGQMKRWFPDGVLETSHWKWNYPPFYIAAEY